LPIEPFYGMEIIEKVVTGLKAKIEN